MEKKLMNFFSYKTVYYTIKHQNEDAKIKRSIKGSPRETIIDKDSPTEEIYFYCD